MSFDSLPADLLLKMFHQLPLKDRVRLSSVNRLFNEISEKSISTMRSLEINDDLINYSIMVQTFPSLLESCSPTLESIDVSIESRNKAMLNALAEGVYPKLKRLKITNTIIDENQHRGQKESEDITKKLISRNRNLCQVYLYLNHECEWPGGIVFEKMEKLVVQVPDERCVGYINLSLTLRPLIGNVPNLKRLTIKGHVSNVLVENVSQLLASTPFLEELTLDFWGGGRWLYQSFNTAVSTWRLPNLITLSVNLNYPIPPSIFHHFPASFPRLKSFASYDIWEIDDQAVMALSHLKHLRELWLPDLKITKENSKMIPMLQSIAVLEIYRIDYQYLQALSQMEHLRQLCLRMHMSKSDLINVITSIPSLAILGISSISDVSTPQTLIEFLTSTSTQFHQNLEIRLSSISIWACYDMEVAKMAADLEELKKNGGPMVDMDGVDLRKIRYNA